MAKKADPWSAPEWLAADAHPWWDRIVSELRDKQLLERASRLTVGLLAQAFLQYDAVTDQLNCDGPTQERGSADGGTLYEMPAATFDVQQVLLSQMIKLIKELKLNSAPDGDSDSSAIAALHRQLQSRIN